MLAPRPWSTRQFLWGYGGWLFLMGLGCFFEALSALGNRWTGHVAGMLFSAAITQSVARSEARWRGWNVDGEYPPTEPPPQTDHPEPTAHSPQIDK